MKKFYFLAAAMLLSATTMIASDETRATAYIPEEFVESEWTFIGNGYITPGYFDYFGKEDGGTMEIPYNVSTKVYERISTPGDYWVEPMTSIFDPEEYLIPSRFVVHIQDPKKVWMEPYWWQHPLLFCFMHAVPETMGYQGSASNYGEFNEQSREVSFPASCFVITSLPTGSGTTNNNGDFVLYIPDPAGVDTLAGENAAAVYYTIDGARVENPEHGLFIEKRGNKVVKVIK